MDIKHVGTHCYGEDVFSLFLQFYSQTFKLIYGDYLGVTIEEILISSMNGIQSTYFIHWQVINKEEKIFLLRK